MKIFTLIDSKAPLKNQLYLYFFIAGIYLFLFHSGNASWYSMKPGVEAYNWVLCGGGLGFLLLGILLFLRGWNLFHQYFTVGCGISIFTEIVTLLTITYASPVFLSDNSFWIYFFHLIPVCFFHFILIRFLAVIYEGAIVKGLCFRFFLTWLAGAGTAGLLIIFQSGNSFFINQWIAIFLSLLLSWKGYQLFKTIGILGVADLRIVENPIDSLSDTMRNNTAFFKLLVLGVLGIAIFSFHSVITDYWISAQKTSIGQHMEFRSYFPLTLIMMLIPVLYFADKNFITHVGMGRLLTFSFLLTLSAGLMIVVNHAQWVFNLTGALTFLSTMALYETVNILLSAYIHGRFKYRTLIFLRLSILGLGMITGGIAGFLISGTTFSIQLSGGILLVLGITGMCYYKKMVGLFLYLFQHSVEKMKPVSGKELCGLLSEKISLDWVEQHITLASSPQQSLLVEVLLMSDIPEKEKLLHNLFISSLDDVRQEILSGIFKENLPPSFLFLLIEEMNDKEMDFIIEKIFFQYLVSPLNDDWKPVLYHVKMASFKHFSNELSKQMYSFLNNQELKYLDEIFRILLRQGKDSDIFLALDIIQVGILNYRNPCEFNLLKIVEKDYLNLKIVRKFAPILPDYKDLETYNAVKIRYYDYEILTGFRLNYSILAPVLKESKTLLSKILLIHSVSGESHEFLDQYYFMAKDILDMLYELTAEKKYIETLELKGVSLLSHELDVFLKSSIAVVLRFLVMHRYRIQMDAIYELVCSSEKNHLLQSMIRDMVAPHIREKLYCIIDGSGIPVGEKPRPELLKLGIFQEPLYEIYQNILGNEENKSSEISKMMFLKETEMFRELDYYSLKMVSRCFEFSKYESDEMIIEEGSEADKVFLLIDGKLDIIKNNTVIAEINNVQIFGELGVIENGLRTTSVKASVPSTTLVAEGKLILDLLQQNGNICFAVCETVTKRLRSSMENI